MNTPGGPYGPWTVTDVANYLALRPSTVRGYAARRTMPPPDGHLGATPWWHPETIRKWRPQDPRDARSRIVGAPDGEYGWLVDDEQ